MATTAPDLGPGAKRPLRGALAGERRVVRTSRPGYAALRAVGLALGSVLVVGSAISTTPSMLRQDTLTQHALPGDLTSLSIKAPRGDVQVSEVGEAGKGIEPQAWVATSWTLAEPEVELVDLGEGSWSLSARCIGNNFGSCSADLEVQVPAGAQVEVVGTFGDVDVRTDGAVDVRTTGGDILVDGRPSSVAATTTFGDVSVTVADEAPSAVSVRTTTGDVQVTVPRSGTYEVLAQTAQGERQVSVPTQDGAPHTVTVQTTLGDVTVAPSG